MKKGFVLSFEHVAFLHVVWFGRAKIRQKFEGKGKVGFARDKQVNQALENATSKVHVLICSTFFLLLLVGPLAFSLETKTPAMVFHVVHFPSQNKTTIGAPSRIFPWMALDRSKTR